MSDFIVRFHGIELPKEQQDRIQAAIQKTVLAEVNSSALPNFGLTGNGQDLPGVLCYWPPYRWCGIWIGPPWELDAAASQANGTLTVVQENKEQ